MRNYLLVLAVPLLSLLHLYVCTSDEFCVEKEQLGDPPGTVYSVYESCEVCACDGAMRMFCAPDAACKAKKREEYISQHRKPCFAAGNIYVDSSQVQQGCNVCTCRNATWDCTQEPCDYGAVPVVTEVTEQHRTYTPTCVDTDDRCTSWINRKGTGVCQSNNYIKKKCRNACNTCPKVKKGKPGTCKDLNSNCPAWSRKANLCSNNKQVIKKCRESCNFCTGRNQEQIEEYDVEELEPCEDLNSYCPEWVQRSNNICTNNDYLKLNCKLSCNFCSQSGIENEAEEWRQKSGGAHQKSEQQLAEEAELQVVEEWKTRLVAEGKLRDENVPDGCQYTQGGRVYPWGSQLQGDCGVCTCRRNSPVDYYFDCNTDECPGLGK